MLAPGLRLGWITAVRPIVDQLALIKQQVDPHTQNLSQLVVCQLVEQGVLDRHLATLKAEHRRRRDAMVQALREHVPAGALRFSVPDGGMYLWCQLAGERARARRAGPRAPRIGDGPDRRAVLRRPGRRPSAAHLLHVAAARPARCTRRRRLRAASPPPRTRCSTSRGTSAWCSAPSADCVSPCAASTNPPHASRQPNRRDHHRRAALSSTGCAPPTPISTAAPSPCRARKPYGSAFLLPEFELEEDLQEWVEDNARGSSTSSSRPGRRTKPTWPATRDLKTFREWFRVDIHSVVVDVGDDDIEGEEL